MKATPENIQEFEALIGRKIWVHISDGISYHANSLKMLLEKVTIVQGKLLPTGLLSNYDATRHVVQGGYVDCIKTLDDNEVVYGSGIWRPQLIGSYVTITANGAPIEGIVVDVDEDNSLLTIEMSDINKDGI